MIRYRGSSRRDRGFFCTNLLIGDIGGFVSFDELEDLEDEQPYFGLEGEVKTLEEVEAGETYTLKEKDQETESVYPSFAVIGEPVEGNMPVVNLEGVSEGAVHAIDLRKAGLKPYEGGWHPHNTLVREENVETDVDVQRYVEEFGPETAEKDYTHF